MDNFVCFYVTKAWSLWMKNFNKKQLNLYFVHIFSTQFGVSYFLDFNLIGLALLNLVIILAFIILLMKIYFTVNKLSFYLFLPYFVWTSYALILNSAIYYLNCFFRIFFSTILFKKIDIIIIKIVPATTEKNKNQKRYIGQSYQRIRCCWGA